MYQLIVQHGNPNQIFLSLKCQVVRKTWEKKVKSTRHWFQCVFTSYEIPTYVQALLFSFAECGNKKMKKKKKKVFVLLSPFLVLSSSCLFWNDGWRRSFSDLFETFRTSWQISSCNFFLFLQNICNTSTKCYVCSWNIILIVSFSYVG